MRLTKLNELIKDGKSVKGLWRIGRGHEVQYLALGKEENVKVRGTLIAAEPGTLIIAVDEKRSDEESTTRLWKLSGKWKPDDKNQLAFDVKRSQRSKDTLIFQGHWDLKDMNGLVFSLDGGTDTALKFRGAFQTKSILAKKGQIRYQIGAEATGRRRGGQEIVLFGKWKYSDRYGLSFEMEYEAGRKKSILFGGELSFNEADTVELKLKTAEGKPLGVELLLTRDIFGKDGQLFARFLKWAGETRTEAGMRLRW